jgi:hypothetical protein
VVVVLPPLSGIAFKASRSPRPRCSARSELPPCTNAGEGDNGNARVGWLGWWWAVPGLIMWTRARAVEKTQQRFSFSVWLAV